MARDRTEGPPPAMFWELPEMRVALAAHDLRSVFLFLHQRGFSQRRIGGLTGQSQSEISAICNDGREVGTYGVLLRIADGLGIPRGYMGLGRYDSDPATAVEVALTSGATGTDEAEEIRRLLAHAAEVTMGVALPDTSRWWRPMPHGLTPVPDQVSDADVSHVQHMTRVLRALDYQHGGGSCREAVVAQARYARMLLAANCDDEVRTKLQLVVADLHNLAGWTSFDVGMYPAARRHFGLALEQAKACEASSLVANVLYRLGRVHLHQEYTAQALRFFQLGQLAAQDAEQPLTVAMLHANEAWTHALMGSAKKATNSLGRAQDEFTRGRDDGLPSWVSFFGEADLHALMGMVYGLLPGEEHVSDAIKHLSDSITRRGGTMVRSTVFELTALGTIQFKAGEVGAAVTDGHRAVDLAETLRSVRAVDRLAPLQEAAERHRGDEGAAQLAYRIATLRGG